jgi:mRNA-degrading endonuclease toxin of MazEF toxin-antitoxin module
MLFRHDFGPRSNHSQEGIRPVVVVQADALNRIEGYGNVIVVPLTTREKKSETYVPIAPAIENKLERPSWAITNQIFAVSREDLNESLGRVNRSELYQIKEGLKISLAIR